MFGDGNNFNFVVRQVDKQSPIFSVYPERINKTVLGLQEFCFLRKDVKDHTQKEFSSFLISLKGHVSEYIS